MKLREMKKEKREQRIIAAAIELFSEHGLNGVTMEQVAVRAVLGTGTLYNYFKCKNDLLVTIVARETDEVVRNGELLLDNPPDDPVEAFTKLFSGYTRDYCKHEKRFLREVFSVLLVQYPALGMGVLEQDLRLVNQIYQLLTKYREKELFIEEAESLLGADVLYGLFSMQFLMYITFPEMEMKFLDMAMERKLRLIFHGFYKRIGDGAHA